MTRNQTKVYDFIRTYMALHKCAPTGIEISKHNDISPGGVTKILRALDSLGKIKYIKGSHRGIELVNENKEMSVQDLAELVRHLVLTVNELIGEIKEGKSVGEIR